MKEKLFTLLVVLITLNGFSQPLVSVGTDGKLVYKLHANTNETNEVNIIPDFSYAGYMGGGVKIPVGEVPVKITLSPQASGEDRTRIQAAIDQVCAMPFDANGFRGAVLLKAGTYRLNDGNIPVLTDGYGTALKIWASGVVLRGEGQGANGTVLYSNFNQNHTMITLEPVSKSVVTSNFARILTDYVGTGAKSFTVASTTGYAVGDLITVYFTPNQTWLDDIKVNVYISNPADYWTTAEYRIGQKRLITAIVGTTITIDCPIVQPMQTKYGGGEISKISWTGRLNNVGVEDLRIEGGGTDISASTSSDRLRAGMRPRWVDNSWVHGVTNTRTSEAAIMCWEATKFTAEECAYIDPMGPVSGGWRYGFCLDAVSTRVLFQRCFSEYGRHDVVTHARIPGPNVFLDICSEHGLNVLGPHHRWAVGTLFDNIKAASSMEITEFAATSGGHAWCGAQTVGWNLECASYVNDAAAGAQNYAIGCIGPEVAGTVSHTGNPGIYRGYWESQGTHLAIRSLYLKQLEDRLGVEAVANIATPEQQKGNIYAMLSAWGGEGPLIFPNASFVSQQDIPATLTPGQTATVSITMKNSGSNAWTKSEKYNLGSQNAQDNISWGINRVMLADNESIAPDATKIFSFNIVAPAQVGTYNFQWKMVKDGFGWFGSQSANMQITVAGSPAIPVTGITVSPVSAQLIVGNSQQLTTIITPLDATIKIINWTSSNSAIATVNSNGLVTAVGAGSATITATTEDAAKTATFELTASGVAVTGFEIIPSTGTLAVGRTKQLTTIFTPANATNKNVNWTTSNSTVATVNSSGLVSAISEGIATITGTTQNGAFTSNYSITTTRYLDDCDNLSSWNTASIALNTADEKQGTGCIQFSGIATPEFSKVFATPYNSGATEANGLLTFWYYVSDVTKTGSGQVEIGSGGAADVNEYNWLYAGLGLVNGWNNVSLDVSKAGKLGTPNLNAINWFRIYNTKTASITTRIDAIRLGINSAISGIDDVRYLQNNTKSVRAYANALSRNNLSIDMLGFENTGKVEVKIINLMGQTVYQISSTNTSHIELNTSGILQKSVYLVSVESGQVKATCKLLINF